MKILKFTKANQKLINEGKKICTARREIHKDPRVAWTVRAKLIDVKDQLYEMEGYESPEEFEKVWRGIHRGNFDPEKIVHVHFGWFGESLKEYSLLMVSPLQGGEPKRF